MHTEDFYSFCCYINSLIPQTAILTTFREPKPSTSHFNILSFKPGNFQYVLKVIDNAGFSKLLPRLIFLKQPVKIHDQGSRKLF